MRAPGTPVRPWLPGVSTAPETGERAGIPVRPVGPQTAGPVAERRADRRNLALILGGWAVILLLIPPGRAFPVIDDWIYAGSVRDLLQTGHFVMPDWSQANLVGLTFWGALWAKLWGFSLTTLTFATLVLAAGGLCAFYGLARAAGVRPAGALLGTALLGGNPIFLHLSYSFMTDVPFLALALGATYGYVRGIQSGRAPWLIVAGLLAGYAFLIRQYGLLVPLAFLGYLVLAGRRARRLPWRALLLTAVVPGLIIGGWYLATRATPPSSQQAQASARAANFVFKEPWLHVFVLRTLTLLPLTALMAWSALRIAPARRWLIPAWGLALAVLFYLTDTPDQVWIAMYEPPFVAHLGPLSYALPQQPFSFAAYGDIVQMAGFSFDVDGYTQERIWTPEIWRLLWLAGAALGAGLLAAISSSLWDWLRTLRGRAPLSPRVAVYALGALVYGVSLAFPGDLFDRYSLAFMPFVILFVVRGSAGWGRRAWAYALVGCGLVAGFTLLAQADYMEHMATRWQAAEWLQARAGGVQAGFDWEHWGGTPSDGYKISDVPDPGYRIEQAFPYTSRLSGFAPRTVLAESRADRPPLPPAPPVP